MMAYISLFRLGGDFHEHAAVLNRPAANHIDEDKPDTDENKQSALNDKAVLNDGASPLGNSGFFCLI